MNITLEDNWPHKTALNFLTVLTADFSPLRCNTEELVEVQVHHNSVFLCQGQTETLLIACFSVPT